MVPNGEKIISMASIFGLVAMERQGAYASRASSFVTGTTLLVDGGWAAA